LKVRKLAVIQEELDLYNISLPGRLPIFSNKVRS